MSSVGWIEGPIINYFSIVGMRPNVKYKTQGFRKESFIGKHILSTIMKRTLGTGHRKKDLCFKLKDKGPQRSFTVRE